MSGLARGLLGWVAVAVWLLATSLAAQDPLLSAALGEKDVSAERVKSRLEALTKDSQLDKGARQELESAYRGALAEAEAADRLRQQLAQKRALGADGVAQIERVRRPLPPARDPATLGLLQLEELESRLKVARAAVDAAANAVRQAEAQVADLAARQKELPKRIAAGEKRIRELEEALRIAAAVETDALRKTAGQTLAACRLAAARLDHAVAQAELQTFSLANELAGAKLERARAEQQRAAAWVAEIGKVLQVRLQEDVNQEIDRAARQMREVESGNPVLREALRDNLERARLRRDVQVELPGLRQRVQEVQKTLADSRQRFAAIRKMITQIGLTQTTGEMLRQQRARLPDPATHQRQRAKLQEQSNGIRLKQMLLAEELAIDVERFVDRVRQAEPEAARAQIEPLARTVHADRQEILGKLQRDYDEQLNELARLESEELVLQQFAGEFSGFIDEKILWVRSSVPIWQSDFRRLPKVLDEMGPLLRFPEAAVRGARDSVVELGLMGILLLGLIGLRPRLLRGLKTCAEQVKRPLDTSMHPTTLAVLLTAALAAPPAVLLWMVNEVVRSYEVVQVVGVGMARATAGAVWLAWPLEFFRQACRTNGLAREQFGWPPAAVSRLSRALLLLGMVGVPVLLLVRSLDSAPEHVRSLVSRPVLALAWLLMALLLGSLLRPDSGLLGAAAAPERRMARRTRVIIMAALVCASLAVVVLALTGWFFTARHLSARLLSTLGFLLGLSMVASMVNRWQLISRRNLAIRQRRERAAAAARVEAGEPGQPGTAEPPLDVGKVSAQTKRLTSAALWFIAVLSLFGIWADVLPAFGALREVAVWKTTAEVAAEGVAGGAVQKTVPVSLADVLLCLLTVLMTVVAAHNIPGLLRLSVLQSVRPGNQYAIAALVQYGIVVLGAVLAFAAIGIGWAKVQWLIAAVSLGLGFGLQEIFANFVSGLILLFERPIRVGDFVTVGGVTGEVTQIRIRATTVRNFARQELIVPNKEFITGQVMNWTLSDTLTRFIVSVGVAYGSDVTLVCQTLLRLAAANELVLADPAPRVFFKEFGDNALVIELRVFVASLDFMVDANNSMHIAVEKEFRRLGIEIAFPQRDIHIRGIEGVLALQREPHRSQDGRQSEGAP